MESKQNSNTNTTWIELLLKNESENLAKIKTTPGQSPAAVGEAALNFLDNFKSKWQEQFPTKKMMVVMIEGAKSDIQKLLDKKGIKNGDIFKAYGKIINHLAENFKMKDTIKVKKEDEEWVDQKAEEVQTIKEEEEKEEEEPNK